MSVWKQKPFLIFWIAVCLTYALDTFIQMGLIQQILHNQTHAGQDIALVFLMSTLPSFLFSFVSGFLNDKFPKTNVLILGNLVKLVPLGFFFFQMQAPHFSLLSTVLITSFCLGMGSAFFYNAKQTFLPQLLEAKDLQAGNAIVAASGTILILLSGVVSPFILEKIGGIDTPFVLVGISVLWILASLLFRGLRSFDATASMAGEATSLWQNVLNARQYLKTHRSVKDALRLSVVLSLVTAVFFHSFNAIGADVYQIGLTGIGKLKAMLGGGMLLGAVLCILLGNRIKPSYLIALCFLILMVTLSSASVANTYLLALFWLIPIGMANAGLVITTDTLLQRLTPTFMRGKIFGLKSTATSFVFLVGTGIVAQLLGMVSPFFILKVVAILSLVMLLVVLFFDASFSFFILRSVVTGLFKRFFPLTIEGAEHIPPTGCVLLAGNHTGWLDTLIITSAVKRPIWFIAGPAAFQIPVIRRIVPHLNVIALTFGKGMQALDNALVALKKGRAVLLFPEGRLTEDGQLNPFQRGIGYLHSKSNAPIVPFYIEGGFHAWGVNRLPQLNTPIRITFGEARHYTAQNDKQIAKSLESDVLALGGML